jgi:hypothetical protein
MNCYVTDFTPKQSQEIGHSVVEINRPKLVNHLRHENREYFPLVQKITQNIIDTPEISAECVANAYLIQAKI